MANPQQAPQAARPAESPTGRPFADRNAGEKIGFLIKAVVMLCSGGFIYPNIFVE